MTSAGPPRNPDKTTIALLGKNPELKTKIQNFILKGHKAISKTFTDFTLKENKSFRIINTPDFLDETCLDQKIIDLIALSDPGPDVFMLALDSDEAKQVKEAEAQINKLQHIFGETVRNHLVIIVENNETKKQLNSHYNKKLKIQAVSENLPDQLKDWLPDQSFQLDCESYFQNAVKRRKRYLETTRHECFHDHRGARGPDLSLQSSPQRIPPEYGLGNAHGGSGTETIVLLGKAGTGKSASANTILAAGSSQLSGLTGTLLRKPQLDPSQQFDSRPSSTPVTTKCEVKMAEICGTQVRVVDTPDFFYEQDHVDQAQIDECKKYCQPWQCVVLLVVQLGRFTDGEGEILEKLEEHLEWRIREKATILFTHGEGFSGSLEEFIGERSHLKKMVDACDGRYHVFKNTVRDSRQVFALFKIIFGTSPNLAAKPPTQCSLL